MTTATASGFLSTLRAPGDTLLRLSLRTDALVTGVNGLAYLALSGPIESLLGLDQRVGVPVGIFLTVYAMAVAVVAQPARISRGASRVVIAVNVGWTVASLIALAGGMLEPSVTGAIWTVLQAVVVGAFAALQYQGLRQAR
ncbi:hypothetical protein [Nocardia donostiensis]|uniref:Integral membrane protein n=1 Tax=Nocardia donostiensis TaxID=1538463 RepID=A0A1W0B016_9NOCA|nr:hypothetical protein [Nocardia donostiensis]ONM50156.1 hypothetical protein B0T46_03465 [Nocardia donostiensis]OQS15818.1 hypothetical protein B0T36_07560 [Nocardia donostiensis]OQS23623.1 hypothetical protein B0T44_02000 [Nocardia donostiensis]